jgi:hypothetical protein
MSANGAPVRRVAPAIGLFLLAPLVAEFLLGNLPITFLPGLVMLAPMYGGGALLIRELTRRAGRGVPTMLVLGIAYGLVEEGLTTQSLFNPGYGGGGLLAEGFLPALGIAVPWTVFVLTLHAVWSITVSIVLMESCVPSRRTTPWLRTPGLVVTGVLFALGIVATTLTTLAQDPFVAPVGSLVGAAVLAVLVAALAFRLPRAGVPTSGPVPVPLLLGAVGLAAGAVFITRGFGIPGWAFTGVILAIDVVLAASVLRWSGRAAWTGRHTLALAGGALLTYAWHAFPETTFIPVPPAVDLTGNVIFAAGALVLLAVAAVRTGGDRSAQESRQSHPIRTPSG